MLVPHALTERVPLGPADRPPLAPDRLDRTIGRTRDGDACPARGASCRRPAGGSVPGDQFRSRAVAGGGTFVVRRSFNEDRLQNLQDPITWPGYLTNADFWSRTLQNWQSEFLAVGAMAVLSIYLRQRGSPESKPVGEPHDSTGIEG